MSMHEHEEYTEGSVFHSSQHPQIYPPEKSGEDRFFKQGKLMKKVVYRNAHENHNYPENEPKHGSGLNFCKWITSEQPDTAEHFSFNGNLNGILESWLEPGASVGWHRHDDTEEYYYILEGTMYAECEDPDGRRNCRTLEAGDLHRICRGMSHYARAGENGVKFMAIIVKAVN